MVQEGDGFIKLSVSCEEIPICRPFQRKQKFTDRVTSRPRTFPSRDPMATGHLNASPLGFLQHRSGLMQPAVPSRKRQLAVLAGVWTCPGTPASGAALGSKLGTMAHWAQGPLLAPSKREPPPLRSTITGSGEAGTSQPPASRAGHPLGRQTRYPAMTHHQTRPQGGHSRVPQSCLMWVTRVRGISKTQRKGPWGRVQNKPDNTGSLGLSD